MKRLPWPGTVAEGEREGKKKRAGAVGEGAYTPACSLGVTDLERNVWVERTFCLVQIPSGDSSMHLWSPPTTSPTSLSPPIHPSICLSILPAPRPGQGRLSGGIEAAPCQATLLLHSQSLAPPVSKEVMGWAAACVCVCLCVCMVGITKGSSAAVKAERGRGRRVLVVFCVPPPSSSVNQTPY